MTFNPQASAITRQIIRAFAIGALRGLAAGTLFFGSCAIADYVARA
ncbi:hypothetical protein [Chromobacterium haemolyticum]|nr:hypothetical protein [Chromobacterium haemolyticum]